MLNIEHACNWGQMHNQCMDTKIMNTPFLIHGQVFINEESAGRICSSHTFFRFLNNLSLWDGNEGQKGDRSGMKLNSFIRTVREF